MKLPISSLIRLCLAINLLLYMAENANAQERQKSPEELKLEEEAQIAKLKQQKAEAEYNAAKATSDAAKLSAPAAQLTEQQQAESQKVIAQAERDAIQARRELFKGPDITAPTGKISTNDGVFIESRVLAHVTLTKTLVEFVKGFGQSTAIQSAGTSPSITLMIYNPTDMPAIELYASVKAQLDEMERAYTRINARATTLLSKKFDLSAPVGADLADPMLVGYAASGILRTVADIVSLFRTTIDFKNSDLAIDETLLIASLTQAIREEKKAWKLFYPAVFPINTIKSTGTSSPFISKLNDISSQSKSAEGNINQINARVKTLESQLASEKAEANKKRITEFIDKFTPVSSELKALNTSYTQLQTMLSAVDTQTKITAQALIMRAERILIKLNEQNVFTVKLLATSRGSNKVTENLWRSARITHSAGTELSCLVFDATGEVVFADSRIDYTPYMEPDAIRKSVGLP